MNKLWLSAITAATLLLGATAANAGGDRHRHGDDNRWRSEYRQDRGHHHHHGRGHGYGHQRPVYYRPVPVYRPVYYHPVPVYQDYGPRGYYRGDSRIHGTISVGF